MKKCSFVILCMALFTHPVLGQNLQSELNEFKSNPKKFLNTLPPKKKKSQEVFSKQAISGKDFVKIKDDARKKILDKNPKQHLLAAMGEKVEDLVEIRPLVKKLEDMEQRKLRSGEVLEQPWSDSYWPIYAGITGQRYADPEFPGSSDWKANFDYVSTSPAPQIFATRNSEAINYLSPSEKYDLLLGAQNALTQKAWSEGKYYYDESGKVEGWMGICHGWAPAAYMLPRPLKAVEVMAADGQTKITFYPSDIKALATQLWANARTPSRFIGQRCNDKNPPQDANGRITSTQCFDNNPAAWHLSVINQIGVAKRSFVLDATYDYEVWNQPILSYSYRYFNPKTLQQVSTLAEATVNVSDFQNDKFKSYRSPMTKKVVGIYMDLSYMTETSPSQAETDSPDEDASDTVYYMYDLELDENNEIIGGEWYRNAHPDFLWTPGSKVRALSPSDYYILSEANWNGENALPQNWKQAGLSATKYSLPLGKIVESLIELSRQ